MTYEEYCQLISDVSHVPIERFTKDASFRDDLGIDSLQLVNVLTQCFDKLGVGFEVIKDSENLRTVGNLYQTLIYGGKL